MLAPGWRVLFLGTNTSILFRQETPWLVPLRSREEKYRRGRRKRQKVGLPNQKKKEKKRPRTKFPPKKVSTTLLIEFIADGFPKNSKAFAGRVTRSIKKTY